MSVRVMSGGNHNVENIIEAREKVERERKLRKGSFGLKMPTKVPAKDDFLGKHFNNRDIVSQTARSYLIVVNDFLDFPR